MNEKNFTQYLWEMWDIAKENNEDVGVGRDMFWANLNNHGIEGAEHYNGAEHLDYAKLSAAWKSMTQEEQWEQKILCGYVSRKNAPTLAKVRYNGDRDKWEAIVAETVKDFYAEKEDCE